jgi:predicted SAM-dependent methyltransferase
VHAAPAHDPTELEAWAESLGSPSPPARVGPRGRLAAAVPVAARPALRRAATALQRPRAQRRAARLAAGRALRLHLGCGPVYKRDWVNVDLAGTRVDLAWDLRRPLPFAAGAVDAIFHEHLLEHLSYSDGLALHRRCRALLRPGGVLRIGVPDAGAALRAYADGADAHPWPTPLARIAALAYDHGHRALYDAQTLALGCRAAGFASAAARPAGESALDPCPDTESRRDHTLYVEAIA